jgi:isopentenyldiphosphate isomerase
VQELFEIFSDEGAPAGLAARNDVHRLGLWYRASNVFLFRTDGRLVIQRRHRSKDVWPDAWDLSVAEHLKPGETFLKGAIRGLREEFGIEGVTLKALSDEIRCRLEVPESGIKAYELQVCYHRVSDADLACDFDEVAAIRFVTVDELEAAIRTSPHEFTPSLRDRARDIGLFERLRNG